MSVPFRLCVRAAVAALALVAPLPGMALAQEPTHVVGQVQDSSTQKPLASVRVTVVGTAVETVTEANGRYALDVRSEEHTSELQSQSNLVCRLLLEKKNT